MRYLLLAVFAYLIVSPALFQPADSVEVQRYPRGTVDPVVTVEPSLTGYDFIFSGPADDYPVKGLACNNSPYPYVSAMPLDTQIGFDARFANVNNTRDIPYLEGMDQRSVSDSRIILTNNDIWTDVRQGSREEGETLTFGSGGNYTWPGGGTFQGPTIQWGLPQQANSGSERINTQYPMIRTDYRHLFGGGSFFADDSIDTWVLVDNHGREMLNALGEEHANKNDFRMFVWDIVGGQAGGRDYFSRNTDAGRDQMGNYTYYQDATSYFRLTTDENGNIGVGNDVLESYAYMIQWTAFYGGNRYSQGPDGNLPWYPDIRHVSTGFPGSVLQETNSMQLVDSYYLDEHGEGYRAADIHKGDMLAMMRSSNIDRSASGMVNVVDRPSPGRVSPVDDGGLNIDPVYSDQQIMIFDVYTLTDPSEEGSVLFRHNNATADNPGKIVGYHFRPVYDTFSDDVDPRARDTMYVPGYAFSNNVEVTCRPFVWSAGGIASPEIIQYGDPVLVEPRFDCSQSYHLPNLPWVHDSGIVFEDVVPDDYCTVRPEDQHIPFNGTILPPSVPVYRDILHLVLHPSGDNATARVTLESNNADYTFAFSNSTTCGARDPINNELGGFQITSAPDTRGVAELKTDFLDTVIDFVWFKSTNPLNVDCQDVEFQTISSGESETISFSTVLPADVPFYQRYITALADDDWGWGTGTRSIDDPNAAPYQSMLFGMPFVAVLGVLSAFVGFSRGHIPAAGITYAAVLGVMTYFEVINLTSAAFGAIITFVILLIFSKGFK